MVSYDSKLTEALLKLRIFKFSIKIAIFSKNTNKPYTSIFKRSCKWLNKTKNKKKQQTKVNLYLFIVKSIKATLTGNESIKSVDTHANLSMIVMCLKL